MATRSHTFDETSAIPAPGGIACACQKNRMKIRIEKTYKGIVNVFRDGLLAWSFDSVDSDLSEQPVIAKRCNMFPDEFKEALKKSFQMKNASFFNIET